MQSRFCFLSGFWASWSKALLFLLETLLETPQNFCGLFCLGRPFMIPRGNLGQARFFVRLGGCFGLTLNCFKWALTDDLGCDWLSSWLASQHMPVLHEFVSLEVRSSPLQQVEWTLESLMNRSQLFLSSSVRWGLLGILDQRAHWAGCRSCRLGYTSAPRWQPQWSVFDLVRSLKPVDDSLDPGWDCWRLLAFHLVLCPGFRGHIPLHCPPSWHQTIPALILECYPGKV